MWMVLSYFLSYGAHFKTFVAKTNDRNLRYDAKHRFLGHFRPFFPDSGKTGIFRKNRAPSLLCLYGPLTSCKRPEKTNEPIPRKVRYKRTNRTDFIGPCRKAGVQKGSGNSINPTEIQLLRSLRGIMPIFEGKLHQSCHGRTSQGAAKHIGKLL